MHIHADSGPHEAYDVAILGGSFTGATLALILARQGKRVVMLDRSPHPRFALGESLLKPTVLWLRVLAQRFNVDELAVVANLNRLHTEVAASSGVKKSFGFVRHQDGQARTVAHWWANIAVNYAEDVLEGHLFRQDVDAWLYGQAVGAGCAALVGELEVLEEGARDTPWRLRCAGREVVADFLVDTNGQSPLARGLAAADLLPLRTDSRSIYTHMIGVRPFDELALAPVPALPWHQGTLHHLLDGAWMWVIPFNNHARSRNPLVSVGVNFDNQLQPADGRTAEQEWALLLARYPALAAQFGAARAVRPWVSTGRLQHAPARISGPRCCLLGQAAGNVDALFSRGLLNSLQGLHLLAETLLDALAARDFDTARFAAVERLQRSLIGLHDKLVHGSYIGFRDVRLCDWWLAMWSFVERLSLSHVVAPLAALERGDTAAWQRARFDLEQGDCIAAQAVVLPVVDAASALMARYAAGESDADSALAELEQLAEPLASLGFDLARFRELATRHGFSATARRLLGAEHALTAAIEILDSHAALPVSLRGSAFVNAVVRLLAIRAARTDAVTLAGQELHTVLRTSLAQVAIPGTDSAVLEALQAHIHSLALRREALDRPRPELDPTQPWLRVIDCHAQGRYVRLALRAAGPEAAELQLLTEGEGERLSLELCGARPDAALLAALRG